jgi:hypothetical protein
MALITPNFRDLGVFPENSMSKSEPYANPAKESTAASEYRGEDGEHGLDCFQLLAIKRYTLDVTRKHVRLAQGRNELRTMMIILGGFVLLGLSVLAGRLIGGAGARPMVTAAKVFVPIWMEAALFNMWVGVTSAGYSVAEELPIFLLIFALPAAGALFIWWKFS